MPSYSMLLVPHRSWLSLPLLLLLPTVGLGQKVDKKAQRERQEKRTEYQRRADEAFQKGDLELAKAYYDSTLALGFLQDVMVKRAEVHRLLGDRPRYCSDIRSASIRGRDDLEEPYRNSCTRRDSVPFSHSGLSPVRFPDATNVTRILCFADGRTKYSIYDSRDSLIAAISTSATDTLFSLPTLDTLPSFPGGLEAMYQHMSKNMRFPSTEAMGRVFIWFVVSKTGLIRDPIVLGHTHPLLDREALRYVSEMPPWTPGIFRGSAVDTEYILPINFMIR